MLGNTIDISIAKFRARLVTWLSISIGIVGKPKKLSKNTLFLLE